MKNHQPWASKSYYFKAGENFASISSSVGMSAHALTVFNLGTSNLDKLGSYLRNVIGFVRVNRSGTWVFDPTVRCDHGRRHIFVPLTHSDRRAVTLHFLQYILGGARHLSGASTQDALRGYYQQIRECLLPHESPPATNLEGKEFCAGAGEARRVWRQRIESAPALLDQQMLAAAGLLEQAPVKVDLPRELRRSDPRQMLLWLQQTCAAESRRHARCYSQCAPSANQSSISAVQASTLRLDAG